MMLRRIAILIIGSLMISVNAKAQGTDKNEKIILVNSSTGTPVSHVGAYSSDHVRSTLSDDDGVVDLSVFLAGDSIYFQHISYISAGYLKSELIKKRKLKLKHMISILDEFVIVASNSKEKKSDVPYMTSIIKSEDLKLSVSQTSAEILSQTGNIMIQKSQGGGGSPVIRGFEANKLLLVVDGVRMNNSIYRGGHLQNAITIDNAILERTEIVFGPSSVIYGSDALGGVIHYYTKHPELADTQRVFVSSNAYGRYATNGNGSTAHLDFNIGLKKFGSLTSYSLKNFGDIEIGKFKDPSYADYGLTLHYAARINGEDSMRVNSNPNVQWGTGYRQQDFLQKFLYQPNKKLDVIANFQYSTSSEINRYDMLNDYSGDLLKFAENGYGPQNRLLGSLKAIAKNDNKLYTNFTSTIAYQRIDEDRFSRKFDKQNKLFQQEDVDVYSANFDFLKVTKDTNKIFYGVDVNFNSIRSDAFYRNIVTGIEDIAQTRYPDGGSFTQSYSAYLNYKWFVSKKIILSAGLRYSYSILKSEFNDTTFVKLPFNSIKISNGAPTGSVSLIYHPSDDWQFNVVASTGFRNPNVDDYGKIRAKDELITIPNDQLVPEYAYNFELGLTKTFNGFISLNTTAFYTLLTNAITRENSDLNGSDSLLYDGDYYRIITNGNAGLAEIWGFSVSLVSDVRRDISFKSTLNYLYGWNKTENVPLGHIPPVFGQTSVRFKVKNFVNEAYILYSAWKKIEDFSPFGEDNEEEATVHGYPGWFTLNLRTNYSINKFLQVQVALENILDAHYKTFASGVSSPGRNFIVTIRGSF